ncbi:MAG TPA: branched-chain amino acid ABC transporter permease [Acidimicrobiales bacterium]|nr:branched-chain amino acid ABC transporter permease [Acidimicrobiales bacterium]
MTFYLSTLAVYFVVYALGTLSLNLQFGLGGIVNFALIIFEAAGAYAASLTSLGPSAQGLSNGQRYFWGISLAFPLPLIAAGLAGGLLALVIGPATMRKMRRDYQAAAMLAVALIVGQVVTNAPGFLNGGAGLSGVPQPLYSNLHLSLSSYDWAYVGWATLLGVLGYGFCRWISMSPFGRTLRAIRDDEDAASAVGKNQWGVRMQVFIIGGVIAGVTGGILVEFIGAWSPSAWSYQETFVLLQAVILGGVGNERGSLVGAFLVGIVLLEAPTFLPAIGYPGLIDSVQWMIIGLGYILILWMRPQGLLRERVDLRLAGDGRNIFSYLRPGRLRGAQSANTSIGE